MLRARNHVLRRAQPASRRLLRETGMFTQMLRPRNSATANLCSASMRMIPHDLAPGTSNVAAAGSARQRRIEVQHREDKGWEHER